MTFVRSVPILAIASFATFALFAAMQALMPKDDVVFDSNPPPRIISFVLEPETLINPVPIDRTLVKPEPPKEAPPKVKLLNTDPMSSKGLYVRLPQPVTTTEPALNLGMADGEHIPILRVNPEYPPRAAEKGISGWAVVEFDIDPYGTVQNASIIAAEPSSIFNNATLKAMAKFRFKPDVVDGTPVWSRGNHYRMVFNMDNN